VARTPETALPSGLQKLSVETYRASGDDPESRVDWIVVEEPLEMRVSGDPIGVTMRTPGHDHELVVGFLYAEGLIGSRADLGAIRVCGRPTDEGFGNVIDVIPAPGTTFDFERAERTRRTHWTSAACGICGRQSIDDLLSRCVPLRDDTVWNVTTLRGLTRALRERQANFDRTGGVHAAGVALRDGTYRVVREDVGRHNAVDKAVGRLLLDDELPARERALVVSGRTSFEIVQKALAARIALVVSVSAPSSLAVATAARANMTLVGFAREAGFNVYSGAERLR
jgi:FdhD protein